MSNAVFLCSECCKYFSSIKEIQSHGCWEKSENSGAKDKEFSFTSQNSDGVLIHGGAGPGPRIIDNSTSLQEHSVSKIPQCYSYVDENKWTNDAIKLLICLYKENEAEFRKPEKRKREVWEKIALELNKEGHIFTTEQVDTKWRNLKKSYWRSKEGQCEIGSSPKFCYEDLLDDIFGQYFPKQLKEKSTNPRVLTNIMLTSDNLTLNQSGRGVKRHYPLQDEFNKSILKNTSSGENSQEERVVDILKKIRADMTHSEEEKKIYRQKKLNLLSQMHEEKINVIKELVEVIGLLTRKSGLSE